MRQKWENITIKISGGGNNAVSDTLNKMGEEGWEAWHLEDRPDSVIIFLKRPRMGGILAPAFGVNGGQRG